MALLDTAAITKSLAGLPGWTREGNTIVKEYRFQDFVGSVLFVNRLAGAAEEADHHPDLDIRWNRVVVRLSTHSQGGITEKDVALAGRADRLA